MPQPGPSDLHVNGLLTDVSIGFIQSPNNFIATKVFKPVTVRHRSGIVPNYDRADFLRDDMRKRAPGTESAGMGYDVSNTDTYFADRWALHQDVDDETRANAMAPYDPDRDATRVLVQKKLIKQEVQWGTAFFSTGVWGNQPTVSATWDDVTSTPLEDIENQKRTIGANTGIEPNTLVLGRKVWADLKNHPDLVDRIKHTSDGPVSTDLLARLLEVDNVFVSRAARATSLEGTTADTFAHILGRSALLCYVPPAPGLMVPSAGYTFNWAEPAGSQDGQRMRKFRMEHLTSDRIEIECWFDMKVTSAALGSFFNNVVTT